MDFIKFRDIPILCCKLYRNMMLKELYMVSERSFEASTTYYLLFIIAICILWNSYFSMKKWYQVRKTRPRGPFGLPMVGYLPFLGPEPHKTLYNMKKKYGDLVGLYLGTKYTVVLNEYNVAKEILSHPGALDRAPNIFGHIPRMGFITEDGNKWQEQRRFCMSSSRDLGLGRSHWEDIVMEEVQNFIGQLQKLKGKPVEISQSLGESLTSNIFSLLFGRRLKKDEEADKIQLGVDFSDVSFSYTGLCHAASIIPGLRKLFEIFKIAKYDKVRRIINGFDDLVWDEIKKHKNLPEFSFISDFINSYLGNLDRVTNQKSIKHTFSEKMLVGNINIIFLASSDTIFSSLTWLFRLMADHRDIQDKCYQEIMDVLGKDGRSRFEERHKIPYTFAVLMEGQRFSNMVPFSATRRANQDIPINGVVIPKGAHISANLWALHNDPNYWEKPELFIPERHLTDNGTKFIKLPPSYAPFSLGRRNCPGETIAWMEILAFFTEIIKKFEITLPPGCKPDYNVVDGLVAHLVPQSLLFAERI